ncbi:MAG: polysaccharide deacetylase family protein [Ginsengibacter sp.]
MILIFTDTVTARLQYVCEFIFKENFGIDFSLTQDPATFISSNLPGINYSARLLEKDAVNIKPTNLLFESNICRENEIEIFYWNDCPAFFKTASHTGDFEFDILSAIFYLVSRYEEYNSPFTDQYGRYDYRQSIAFKNGFLKQPLVNVWLRYFATLLKSKFPALQIKQPEFSFIPTFDVDIAFQWKHKGLIRNAGQFLKLLFSQQYEKVTEGFQVLSRRKKDPFDIFESIDELNEKYCVAPLYFFLVAKQNTRYDKNVKRSAKAIQTLIQKQSAKYEVGIHPSFYSSSDESLLKNEKFFLEEVVGKVIKKSRQHYLRFNLPHTYHLLSRSGITDEYSMGYGTTNGFRASYAGTFYWYDIAREERTNLRIHPFCFMDSNCIFHEKSSPEEAFNELITFFNECKKLDATLITIFHNHLMSSQNAGWEDVYKNFIAWVYRSSNA